MLLTIASIDFQIISDWSKLPLTKEGKVELQESYFALVNAGKTSEARRLLFNHELKHRIGRDGSAVVYYENDSVGVTNLVFSSYEGFKKYENTFGFDGVSLPITSEFTDGVLVSDNKNVIVNI
tara:strand:- start:6044 stop:6412 length:369 start_codon:yes stop_codon:yes gene_type:complete